MKLVAMLALAGILGAAPTLAQQGGMMQGGQGGMMGRGGMMGQREMANLKDPPPELKVESVRYCKGQYFVSTAAGDILEFPEFNLRIKTDMSDKGPPGGKPALAPAGMMGDRAFLVFAQPGEISGYIKNECGPS